MFPRGYFAGRYFAPRYWPGGGTIIVTPGVELLCEVDCEPAHGATWGTMPTSEMSLFASTVHFAAVDNTPAILALLNQKPIHLAAIEVIEEIET